MSTGTCHTPTFTIDGPPHCLPWAAVGGVVAPP